MKLHSLKLGPGPLRIGLIVNPAAGMGGRLGLKGTDGRAFLEALRRGARPVSPGRARRFLQSLRGEWVEELLVPPGIMGLEAVEDSGNLRGKVRVVGCVPPSKWPTTAEDTVRCASQISADVDVLVFVGGDGTARDILDAVDQNVAVLGVPAGVKVYSAVFAVSPEAAARLIGDCSVRGCTLEEREVLDIDEEAFRAGSLKARLYGYLLVPRAPGVIQAGKEPTRSQEALDDIAEQVAELVEDCTLYILGPGSTVYRVAERLGVRKTLLGVDAYHNGELVGRDLDADKILELASRYDRVKIVLTPIGGTGFLLGRGNQQIPPELLRRLGRDSLIIVSDPEKLRRLNYRLLIDTGDPQVDDMLEGPVRVIIGYNRWAMARIVAAHKSAAGSRGAALGGPY